MSEKSKRVNGIVVKPKTTAPTIEGEIVTDSADSKLKAYLDSAERAIVTEDQAATLTNKTHTDPTLDGDLTGTAISTDGTFVAVAASDTKIPSQLAVKTYVDAQILTEDEASEIKYDATASGLDTGDTESNVQDAMDNLNDNVDDLVTLSGVAKNSTDLGTFTGSTISDFQTIKAALQEIETELETKAEDGADITYTPAVLTDWDGDIDPGNINSALDQLAERVDDNEIAITDNSNGLSDHLTDAVDAHDASAISNVPSGNLAATDLQGAVNELQSDIDNRALDSDLTTHIGDTSTHGVTGDIVGTTDTQDLSNKTFIDAITLEELASTPSNPSAGNKKFYAKNDGKVYTLDSAGTETEVGAGTGGGGSTQFEITQASHGFAVGEGVYHNGTTWVKAQADDADTLAYYVVIAVADVNTFTAADFGRIEATAHGYTVGQFYFLSDVTPGLATTTEPTSGFSNPLFFVEDANTLQIKCLRPSGVDETTLDQLSDVSVPAPTDNQVLAYNNANSRWEAADAVSAAADVTYNNASSGLTGVNVQTAIDEVEARVDTLEAQGHDLGDLTDVDNAAPSKGDMLVYNSVTGNYEALPAGVDGSHLVYDSAEDKGIKTSAALTGTLNPVTDWVDFTPNFSGGFSVQPTIAYAKYRRVGDTLEVDVRTSGGTASAAKVVMDGPSGLFASDNTGRRAGELNTEATDSTYRDMIVIAENNYVEFRRVSAGLADISATGLNLAGGSNRFAIRYSVKIQGWSSGVDAAIQQTTLDIPVVTDWVDYTPSVVGGLSFSSSNWEYRRIGDSLELRGYGILNAGVSGVLGISLPSGLTIDDTVLTALGSGHSIVNSISYDSTIVRGDWTVGSGFTNNGVLFLNGDGVSANLYQVGVPNTWASGNEIRITSSTMKIQGWTATETVPAVIAGTFENINSSDLYHGEFRRSSAQTIPSGSGVTVIYDNTDSGNIDGSFNTSTGVFTAPRNGNYLFCARAMYDQFAWGIGNAGQIVLTTTLRSYNLDRVEPVTINTDYFPLGGSHVAYLNEGDIAQIQISHNNGVDLSLIASGAFNILSISESATTESIIKNLVGSDDGKASGINYILNSDMEVDLSGYVKYLDAAGLNPVDGIGGTATISIDKNTVAPLRGSADLKLTKGAGSKQGEGFSYNFTIDSADKAQMLTTSFDYDASIAGYNDGDIRLSVYDVTNSQLIRVNGEDLKAGKGKHYFQFQTSSNSVNYRLIVHISSINASAYDVYFDNFQVGPREITRGAIITEWEDYTPTGTWTSNTTYTGHYRRVGDSLEVRATISVDGGSPNSSALRVSLPSGLSVDSAKLNGDTRPIGLANLSDSSSNSSGAGAVYIFNSTNVSVRYLRNSTIFDYPNMDETTPFTVVSGDFINVEFTVPIQGWASSGTLNEDLGGGSIYSVYRTSTATSVSNNANIVWDTEINSSMDGMDTSTGVYTVPETGMYLTTIQARPSTSAATALDIYKNESPIARAFNGSATDSSVNTSISFYYIKGDEITVRNETGVSRTLNGGFETTISIVKLASGSQKFETATVAARYTSNSGQTVLNSSPVIYEDIDEDTHNAYNISTGEYTIPVSGWYGITASARNSAASTFSLAIQAGGTNIAKCIQNDANDNTCNVSVFKPLTKGQVITVDNESGASRTLSTTADHNVFSIARIK